MSSAYRSLPQVQPHADHRATRIHEDGRLTEVRAEQIVGRQAFLRRVVERVEHVQEQLDASHAAEGDRPRHAHIEQRLRRQPARAARLEQDALVALRQRDLRRRRPRLAAEVLQIGGDHEAGPRHVDAAHHPEHVRAIVRQPAARVGEIVRIAPERDALRPGGATVLTCAPAAVVPLEACSPDALDNV